MLDAPSRPESADERLPIVDAHHHFWDLSLGRHPWLAEGPLHPHRYGDYSAVRHDCLPQHYDSQVGRHRIVGNVYVEAEWDRNDPLGETRWVHELSDRTGRPHAMVAQAWLDRDDAAALLAAQAAFPLVRGVRQKPRAFATSQEWSPSHGLAGSMLCERFRAGYAHLAGLGLHFELQTPFWHLPDAADLAAAFPDTVIVINHTGVPGNRTPDRLAAWGAAMRAAAAQPNIHLKISGLGVPGEEWTVEANREVVLTALDIFGDERCMVGSNFPVDGLFRSLEGIFDDFLLITAALPGKSRHRLFHENARRLYRLA